MGNDTIVIVAIVVSLIFGFTLAFLGTRSGGGEIGVDVSNPTLKQLGLK